MDENHPGVLLFADAVDADFPPERADEDEFRISSVDADGVSLAAIQGLYQLIQFKILEARLESIEKINMLTICV